MKFHALAFCLAGTMTIALPAAAQSRTGDPDRAGHDRYSKTSKMDRQISYGDRMHDDRMSRSEMSRHEYYSGDPMATDPYTGMSVYAGGRMYSRQILFPELTPVREVAGKVSEIIRAQRTEIAHLQALAPRAQTAGFQNVSMVYDHMSTDHDRLADFASNWLSERGFAVPSENVTVNVAEMSPQASVDHVIQMHVESYNKNLEAVRTEKSSTVRGLRLWAAATTARHLSLLNQLDREVEFGRKVASARLHSMIDGNYMASDQTALMTRIMQEETEIYRSYGITTDTTTTIAAQPSHVVEVERIVERPVERVVERVVEKPVERIVERVVEKPVYIQQPAPVRSQVAGRRQTGGARRPAK